MELIYKFIVFCTLLSIVSCGPVSDDNQVKLSVYYESLCPDSIRLIILKNINKIILHAIASLDIGEYSAKKIYFFPAGKKIVKKFSPFFTFKSGKVPKFALFGLKFPLTHSFSHPQQIFGRIFTYVSRFGVDMVEVSQNH